MPPWIFGWRVTTRCPRMAGKPVTSAVSDTGIPASRIERAVPPLETRSQPSSWRPVASSTIPVLSYTDSSALMAGGSLQQVGRPSARTASCQHPSMFDDREERGGVQPALDGLDALLERVLGVAGQHGDRLLG